MIGAAVLLYACNKLWFLPAASGPLRLFLAWYFSDLLAGALLLAKGLTHFDVSTALNNQNLVLPAGTAKVKVEVIARNDDF